MPHDPVDRLAVLSLDPKTLAAVDALALRLNRASREAVLAYLVSKGLEVTEEALQAAATEVVDSHT
jgi:hypothetical protein